MNKTRWFIFLTIGIPTQMLMYIIYPFLYLYYRIFVYKKAETNKRIVTHEVPADPFNRNDDHGTLCYYGNLSESGLVSFTFKAENNLQDFKRDNAMVSPNLNQVSGDVVVSWLFAYTSPSIINKPKDILYRLALTYLKNLGARSHDVINLGGVSDRCNNFGINHCRDSQFFGVSQPMAGPQFYTNSALFALASQNSFFFKIIFWVHWILFGGWFWAFMPVIHTKNNGLYYVRDITMKALYVHKYVFGNRWWITKPMKFITFNMSDVRNDLFYAMLGFSPLTQLPSAMDGFFSQRVDCTSRQTDRMNSELGNAILLLVEQSKEINGRK